MEHVVHIATPGFSLDNPPGFSMSLDIERFDPVSTEIEEFCKREAQGVPVFIAELMASEARWIANQGNVAKFITDSVGNTVDRFVVYVAPSTMYYGGMLVIKEILDLYLTTVRKYPSHDGRVSLMLVDDGSDAEAFGFIKAHLAKLHTPFEVVNV